MPDKLPPQLEGRYLLKPVEPVNEQSPSERWIVVEKSDISFDGRECDKIGVGFEAFQNQPNRCIRSAGSCLNNQIDDFLERDRVRIEQKSQPLYSLSRFVIFF